MIEANLVDLEAIASVGSAIALARCSCSSPWTGYRRRAEDRVHRSRDRDRERSAFPAVVLAFFAVDTLRNAPATFIAIVAIRQSPERVALDAIWKRHAADPGD